MMGGGLPVLGANCGGTSALFTLNLTKATLVSYNDTQVNILASCRGTFCHAGAGDWTKHPLYLLSHGASTSMSCWSHRAL